MRCARCAASLPWDSRFCHKCGAHIADDVPAKPATPAGPPAPDTPAPAPAIAQLIQRELGGEITIRGEIGRGPLTVAFAGTEMRAGREVVVFVVPPELAQENRERVQRLLKAARATAKLRHPRVAPVYRVAAGDRLCWYVTAPDGGESLGAVLAREAPLPPERVAGLVAQIAAALACAHEQGMVHGDLTPDNVWIDPAGSATVKDFGIARAAENGTPSDRSLNYRAPELDVATYNGNGAAGLSALTGMSAAADQYALGIITWEMLTGALPFAGHGADEIRREHRTTQLPPLVAAQPDQSPAIATVLERALAKRPADRFPGVGKFAQALRNAMDGRPSPRVSPTPVRKTENVLITPETDAQRVRKGPRKQVLLGALGAGTALTMLALFAWSSSSSDPISPSERARLEAASRTFEAQSAAQPRLDPDPAPATVAPPAPDDPAEPTSTTSAAGGAPAPARPAQPTREQRRAQAAEQSRTSARGTAWVTIGTNPQAAIFINDSPVPTNPVINWPVPAGAVFLRFEVLDNETGVWTRDMVVNAAAGDTVNLRRIRLTRP